MATRHPSSCESVADYNGRIDKFMPITRWKPLKSIFYAVLITALAVFTVRADADPNTVFLAAVSAIIVITSVEVKEVEIAKAVSITFFHESNREEDDDS